MGCDWQLMYKLYVMLLALPQGYSHVNYSTLEAPAAALHVCTCDLGLLTVAPCLFLTVAGLLLREQPAPLQQQQPSTYTYIYLVCLLMYPLLAFSETAGLLLRELQHPCSGSSSTPRPQRGGVPSWQRVPPQGDVCRNHDWQQQQQQPRWQLHSSTPPQQQQQPQPGWPTRQRIPGGDHASKQRELRNAGSARQLWSVDSRRSWLGGFVR